MEETVLHSDTRLTEAIRLFESGCHQAACALTGEILGEFDSTTGLPRDNHARAELENFHGVLLNRTGNSTTAIRHFSTAIELSPCCAEALYNRGNCLYRQGSFSEAAEDFLEALKLEPSDPEYLNNFILSFQQVENKQMLSRLAREICGLEFTTPAALSAVCNAMIGSNHPGAALPMLRSHLAIIRDDSAALIDAGNVCHVCACYTEAESLYQRARKLSPENAAAAAGLGAAQVMLGKFREAADNIRAALAMRDSDASSWNNLGIALDGLSRHEESLQAYNRALAIQPDMEQAHENLARFHGFHGDAELADRHLKWLSSRPSPRHHGFILRDILHCPPIPVSLEDIAARRSRLESTLQELTEDRTIRWANPFHEVGLTPFYLSYQPLCNKSINTAFANLIDRGWHRQSEPSFPASACGKKIRVGLISSFFCAHTISKLNEGLIKLLDRRRFEVVAIISPRTKKDRVTEVIRSFADMAMDAPESMDEAAKMIRESRLDILHFTDIGMDPWTYFLAFHRMARIQTVSWGHPDTTGIPGMDYFISGRTIEIGAAQSHYSEQLIEFRNAPVYFKSAAGPDGNQPMDLSDLPGICADSNIYLCPQTLIKIHPDFDRVMADIHQLDPKAHVIFLEGNSTNWSRRLRQRWKSVEGLDLSRLHFIPRLDRVDFQRFVLAGDVILDPLHFSGGVSTQEILALGQPVVSCPGPMMRSRVTAGFLSACDMHQLIAPSPGDMARIAVETVRDHQKQNAIRQAIRGKSFCLFENFEVIEEFGAFFEAAHESHLSGGRLESWNW